MSIEKIKKEIAEMSDEDLQSKFDLYTDLESIDSKTNVMIELMAQELDKREI
jgi:hypothetical protein